jgi:hypothetical protein
MLQELIKGPESPRPAGCQGSPGMDGLIRPLTGSVMEALFFAHGMSVSRTVERLPVPGIGQRTHLESVVVDYGMTPMNWYMISSLLAGLTPAADGSPAHALH